MNSKLLIINYLLKSLKKNKEIRRKIKFCKNFQINWLLRYQKY